MVQFHTTDRISLKCYFKMTNETQRWPIATGYSTYNWTGLWPSINRTNEYAMLMSPNKGKTTVHGCYCPRACVRYWSDRGINRWLGYVGHHPAIDPSLLLSSCVRRRRGGPWSRRSPIFWTSQTCFLSSNCFFFECEHPVIDIPMVITEPAVVSARLLGLGWKLYFGNMPRMLSEDITRFMQSFVSRAKIEQAKERLDLLAG